MMKLGNLQKSRIKWIDVGKGIGILLVVFGHAFRDGMRSDYFVCNALYTFVYSFHMPLLMYLSGYMFAKKSEHYLEQGAKKYCILKIRKLMKPYIVYAVAVYLIVLICFKFPFIENLLMIAGYREISVFEFLIGVISGENPYSFHLWYIYSLAVLSILSFIIWKITVPADKRKIREPVILVCIICVIFFSVFISERLNSPRIVSAVRGMFPWYFIGCLRCTDRVQKKASRIFGSIALILLGLFCFGIIPFSSSVYTFIKYPLILGAIFGTVMLAQKISSSKVLSYLGRNSMFIYLFHQPFIAAGSGVFFYDLLGLPVAVSVLLTFILSIVLPLAIDKILERLKLRRLLF